MPEPRDLFGTPAPPRRAIGVAADYLPVREDGQFACVVCGAPAAFGSGVNIRKAAADVSSGGELNKDQLGVWLCFRHYREGTG